MGSAISTEARRLFVDKNKDGRLFAAGLDFWAPVINIARDPRWGRIQETPGEDPFWNGIYGAAYVQGMQQGEDPRYLKTIATLKHFAAYSLENFNGTDRHHFDARVSKQDLAQSYFPAFEYAVRESKPGSVMCSYNSINGIPSCGRSDLLGDTLRKQWGFDGYVVGDCDSIWDMYKYHQYVDSPAKAVGLAINSGTDMDCGGVVRDELDVAIREGYTSYDTVDQSLVRLFTARIRLGLFDSYEDQPYMNYPKSAIGSPENRQLARRIAQESLVLLKNQEDILPLQISRNSKIALIGPHINSSVKLCGNYFGDLPDILSPLNVFQQRLGPQLLYTQGCAIQGEIVDGVAKSVFFAAQADAVVLFMGIDSSLENEGHDRYSIDLPQAQRDVIDAVCSVNSKVILVLINGGSLDLSFVRDDVHCIKAVIEAFYPGEEGANAIADTIFGISNPSGRLPLTIFDKGFVEKVDFLDMSMRTGPGRTYRFYQGTPVYPFGYGLSYTSFSYDLVSQSSAQDRDLSIISVLVKLTNTGSRPGAHSVLSFIETDHPNCPRRQLFDVQKFFLDPKESLEFSVMVSPKSAGCFDLEGKPSVEEGIYYVSVGDLKFALKQDSSVSMI